MHTLACMLGGVVTRRRLHRYLSLILRLLLSLSLVLRPMPPVVAVVSVPLVITETKLLSEEVAEQVVQKYGKEVTAALHQNGTILPYSVMKKFTAGHGGVYEAHHILEQKWFRKLMISGNADHAPSVILDKATHQEITRILEAEAPNITSKARLWSAYQKVYKEYPHWLKAIEPYFK